MGDTQPICVLTAAHKQPVGTVPLTPATYGYAWDGISVFGGEPSAKFQWVCSGSQQPIP
jgi:hypothetical protein